VVTNINRWEIQSFINMPDEILCKHKHTLIVRTCFVLVPVSQLFLLIFLVEYICSPLLWYSK